MCDAGNTRVIVANHVLSGEAVARFRNECRGTLRSIPALSWVGHGLTRKQHAELNTHPTGQVPVE
jgi:hypothetical protein